MTRPSLYSPPPLVVKHPRENMPAMASLRTITALMLREMATTYGRSPGGYLWAVLEPAAGLAVLVLIFSTGFRTPPLGTNFGIFYASGLLPFLLFVTMVTKVQQAVNFSKQLLAYPRVTFMDAIIARFLLNLLTQIVVSALILSFILLMYETRTMLRLGALLNAYCMSAALGLGIGMLNCLLVSRQAIWGTVWSIISRPLLLISGVLFIHDKVPQPYRDWLSWNPLVHVVGEARHAFYFSYRAEYVSPGYAYGVALICGVVGALFLLRYTRDLMER